MKKLFLACILLLTVNFIFGQKLSDPSLMQAIKEGQKISKSTVVDQKFQIKNLPDGSVINICEYSQKFNGTPTEWLWVSTTRHLKIVVQSQAVVLGPGDLTSIPMLNTTGFQYAVVVIKGENVLMITNMTPYIPKKS